MVAVVGACVVVLRFGCGDEGGGCGAGGREGIEMVCALMGALAGMASLPCGLHLQEAMFLVWKRSSGRMRTCCNATSEVFE